VRFEEALPYLKDGKKIRRTSVAAYLVIEDGDLLAYDLNKDSIVKSIDYEPRLRAVDLLAEDWEIVE
jgi:hypothetical protein